MGTTMLLYVVINLLRMHKCLASSSVAGYTGSHMAKCRSHSVICMSLSSPVPSSCGDLQGFGLRSWEFGGARGVHAI